MASPGVRIQAPGDTGQPSEIGPRCTRPHETHFNQACSKHRPWQRAAGLSPFSQERAISSFLEKVELFITASSQLLSRCPQDLPCPGKA